MRLILALVPLALGLYVAYQVFRKTGGGDPGDGHTMMTPCPRCGLYVKNSLLRCPRCGNWFLWRLKAAASAFVGTVTAAVLFGLFLYLLGFALVLAVYIAIGAGLAMLVGRLFKRG